MGQGAFLAEFAVSLSKLALLVCLRSEETDFLKISADLIARVVQRVRKRTCLSGLTLTQAEEFAWYMGGVLRIWWAPRPIERAHAHGAPVAPSAMGHVRVGTLGHLHSAVAVGCLARRIWREFE